MKKQEELNLKFYKKMGAFNELAYILDSSNASGNYTRLNIIQFLPKAVINHLIETLQLIQNNQLYDPSFLDSAEELSVFDVNFITPYFWIDGHKTIHMDDLKLLLIEWLEFRSS
ncbi:hypothetical protein [Flavobacterium johnsoniae]|uniref:Uncharacterized protein n=1 Tax=Flavobacterium johnsoniae TaxID=986 RepID=A0A1J7CKZ8_FLAJO|nr:hypothetical protein [Flavobacterium johnsoniae]OIV42232.1 hypothetical protein BKM63_11430 [Flavobacterium johnsoniae]